MSPRKDCCVICGYDIRDYGTLEGKWLMEFRAIGINNSTDDPLQAPSDPTKRYDDENYDRHLTKEFYVTFCWEQTIAFVSHDACWKLFEEALKPDNIPLKRFIDICSSLPLIQIMGLFHWGHTYGGIYTFDNISAFPWEYSFLDQALDAEALRCARVNPWNIPTLRALMAETAHKPPMAGAPILNESSDCFRQFPWEIREAIANKLSTRDALSLRESSRAFQPLLASSTFWASRFQPGLDREFLFESYRRPEIRDWLSLYRSTSQKRSPPGLKNRTRIWNLINYILPLLKLRLAHDESRDWAYKSHETRLVEADAKLMQLVHRRNGSSNVLNDGCRLLKTQQAHIPQSLDSIALSFIEVGNHGHLTGICFSSKDGMKTQLGYLFPNGTMVYKVEDLSGFVLAIDPKGVRGVKIVHSNGDRSAWFGFPEMTPVTERLRVIDTTKPIRVSVDVRNRAPFSLQFLII
ncbi:uncharacterized protein N7483_007383 [Penicillium malachiteum]|uniref:uncharacterized protein n=1 Tax=Penicillium malachiteum TaxID=1324776 RepID=UPI002549C064|nr:uncharacterized protein N7483_007383 [Penicillium malachiteum]KAJ5726026.1 hypothetical protein N7483_007383 [Penicillium malachiteum]